MQEINNINFGSLKITRKLDPRLTDALSSKMHGCSTIHEVMVRAFELGASLDNQEKKKVCMLCDPDGFTV
jgi:hypothetical protein